MVKRILVIGAVPAGILATPEAAPRGGLFGFAGGGAFCAMGMMRRHGEGM